VKHSAVHPKFLHSNSTSHTWAFGAIAELIDNATDPDVCASKLSIDVENIESDTRLVITDNGYGASPETLHKMLSFGFCEKVSPVMIFTNFLMINFLSTGCCTRTPSNWKLREWIQEWEYAFRD
jgi:dolichyl-phosphate-mannose--protein O-mannosyl transferase